MKKLIVALFFLTGLAATSFAQSFKFGVKAGANFTKLKSDEQWLSSETSTGYIVGAWGRIGGGIIHVQPEAYFTSKQTKVYIDPENAASDLVSGDLKFSSIDVPLLIGTKLPLGPIKARVQAGPLFSFAIDQEASYKESISASYEDALNNYKNSFSALVFGVGFDIGKITVDGRYEHGLGNIKENSGKQTLNLWTVGVGFSLF